MTVSVADLIVFLALALVAGLVGVGLGIFFLAPRLSRLADRPEEDARARDD